MNKDIFKVEHLINKKKRSELKNQKPLCIWLTGISASGKSTLAINLEKKLTEKNMHCYVLDGDNLRQGINKDLGFEAKDREQVTFRIGEISRLMVDAGLIVIVACISPFNKEREKLKQRFEKDEFFEIHLNTPLEECIKRDPKKLYIKAKNNSSINNIGIGGLYENPENPFLRIDTSKISLKESVNMLIKKIFGN
tara:strand:- start:4625 stop:5209 length:585 start_codon:yes stop_codon:yes gene_type:complete